MKRWTTILITASLLTQSAAIPVARAQEEDLDALFQDEPAIDEPPPFGEIPPPPTGGFDNPPMGAGVSPGGGFTPPPPTNNFPPPGNSGGGSFGTRPSGGGTAGKPVVKGAPTGDLKERFSKANIEDITNENFPETIESFDFPNADVKDVIKAISELTGKNFIIESSINGRVTIMAPSKITVAEAYKAFLSALAGIGYTIVPSGKFLKIKSIRNAQKDAIETFTGPYYPNADILVTRIVQLKHTSSAEIDRRLKGIISKEGELIAYEPTNSLIITDFGSSIERTMRIINEIDKPGFEETLEVIPIKYAKASELAEMLNQIINKDSGGGGGAGGFRPGVPRFGSRTTRAPGGAPEELSLVAPDERTNAIIVLGTKPGIEKVKGVVRKLDYRLDPSEAGGVFVYYVRFGEAEKIAQVLQGVSQGTSPTGGGGGGGGGLGGGGGFGGAPSATRPFMPAEARNIFGGDVKITADKVTNSLVIVASKQDYEKVKSILSRIDIPRDQVFVEAIIVEMNTQKAKDWNPAVYYFKDTGNPKSNAAARVGFQRAGTLQQVLSPAGDAGAVLGFGSNKTLKIELGGQELTIPNLVGFINFLQTNTEANVLSTPQILALDNEDAVIEVGERIPIPDKSVTSTGIQSSTARYEQATIKMELTPYISPDSNAVRMKFKQTVAQVQPSAAASEFPSFTTRSLQSNIQINSGDTAILGGLVNDQEDRIETKVPLLGDVPVLGWLFKSSRRQVKKNNLLIFLTPKILRNQEDSQQMLTKKVGDRVDWIKENLDGRDPYGKRLDNVPRAQAEGTSERRPQSVKKKKR